MISQKAKGKAECETFDEANQTKTTFCRAHNLMINYEVKIIIPSSAKSQMLFYNDSRSVINYSGAQT